jgi:tRNA(Arg) A34 adenosine deaminase TadA
MVETKMSRRGALYGATVLLAGAQASKAQAVTRVSGRDARIAWPPLRREPERERHAILLSLAMALVFDSWRVNRRRPERVATYEAEDINRRFGDYIGHNVGALVVSRGGAIVNFALNRSVQPASPVEQAEARAVRAAICIANAARAAEGDLSSRALQGACLYTTLEPSVQVMGILASTRIGQVVYAQDDPPQRLSASGEYDTDTPLTIRATFLPAWDELEDAYRRFAVGAAPSARTGLTFFLETVDAYRIYRNAAVAFAGMVAAHPVNDGILRDAQAFRARWHNKIQAGLRPV